MTLAAAIPQQSYVGTGGSNAYTFSFPTFSQSQIVVTVSSPTSPTLIYATLVLGTDYTVSGLSPAGTPAQPGTVTLVNAGQAWLTAGFLTTSWTITIKRVVPVSQSASIRNQGDYYRDYLENALDTIVMEIQQQQLLINNLTPGSGVVTPVSVAQGGTGVAAILAGNRLMVSLAQTIVELAAITASRAIVSDVNGLPTASAITSAQLGYLANLFSYRRPVLQYSSATVVNLETGNLGTSGQASIVFPDGSLISDSTSGHINCNLAQVASTGASPQSGLRTGAVANNTWYAIYAVKANSGAAFVTIADTVLPIQANYATLNSNFGTNSWVYLGMVRNGDNNGVATGILAFKQSGNMTIFSNSNGGTVVGTTGSLLASSAGAAGVTYTYAAGTGAAQMPNNIGLGYYLFDTNISSTNISVLVSAARVMILIAPASNLMCLSLWGVAGGNVTITPGANTGNTGIYLLGFVDTALGVGFNPLL